MVNKKTLLKKFAFVKFDEPLKNHCTFGVGGSVEVFAEPETIEELLEIIKFLSEKKIKFKVLGNASNILFSDEILKGVLITTRKIKETKKLSEDEFLVTSGVSLSGLAMEVGKLGLSGLEFAVGIPATIGGAIFMNAGAFGGEMADVVTTVWYFENGAIKRIENRDLQFGYRHSIFFRKPNATILFAEIKLKKASAIEVLTKINQNIEKRKASQPNGKSAGSIFRKTENYSAGLLIDKCNLKGKTIGGAIISEKHANFILNIDNASFSDIYELITIIKREVFKRFGENLKLEIEIIKDEIWKK